MHKEKGERSRAALRPHTHNPRLDITLDTSSTASSSTITPALAFGPVITAERDDRGEYTLGNEGVVTEVGLDPPVSPVEFSGESGRERPEREPLSVMREREYVRSKD